MDIAAIINYILSPPFLLRNIDFIAEIMAVMVLVMFDDLISGGFIFPMVDKIKTFIFVKAKEKISRQYHAIAKYSAEFLATALFIIYFMFGYFLLSEYIFAPILRRLQEILLIVIILSFVGLSWFFNNRKMRKKYLYD